MATSVGANETVLIQLIVAPIDKEAFTYKVKRLTKNYWLGTMRKNSTLRETLEEAETGKLHKPLFTTSLRVIADASGKSNQLATSIF